jgi:hypothetical protein
LAGWQENLSVAFDDSSYRSGDFKAKLTFEQLNLHLLEDEAGPHEAVIRWTPTRKSMTLDGKVIISLF